MKVSRRELVTLATGSLVWPATVLHAKDTALPVPKSLPQAAFAAHTRGEPLVVLISLPGCVYCELVRRNYLLPARYSEGLQAWQLDVSNKTSPLVGFDGLKTTAAAQAQAWKAALTPTVLFFNNQGREIAERLTGIAVPDFYGAYLDQRLATARKAM